MKLRKLLITTGFILTGIAFFLGLAFYYEKPVSAATTCPYTDLYQCLDYYNQLDKDLSNQKTSVQKKLDQEEYNQLSLQGKINYIDNQITQAQNVIKNLEVEIAASDIEIKLLEKEIQEREDAVSLMKQEISVLEETVNKRITESYKYSHLSAFDLFLDSKSFSNVLRKTKYLITTRSQDIASLEDYSQKAVALKREEEELSARRLDLETKKTESEEEKATLAQQNIELEAQLQEKNSLMAQSKLRETEYLALFSTISSQLGQVEQAEEELMLRLYQTGLITDKRHVNKGDVIGIDGHTGCAFGTHLHFSFVYYGSYRDPSGYLGGILGYPISPMRISGGYSSSHKAIDIVSTNSAFQTADTYTVSYGICPIVDSILNYRKNTLGLSNWNQAPLNGEGAKVYASHSGYFVHKTDQYGANYGMVVSDDGNMVTYYVHLKY